VKTSMDGSGGDCGKMSHGPAHPYLPQAVTLLSLALSSLFPCSCLAILFTGMLIVMTFANERHFGFGDTGWMGPTTVGRGGKPQVLLSVSTMRLLSAAPV
jgi:hypothetical protein